MDWISDITAFDVFALLIFVAFLVRGVWVGFIGQISSLIAMIGGFALAGYFDSDFYRLILPYIKNSHTAFLITYIVLFISFFFLIKLVGLGLKKVMDVSLTTWFDRTVGGLFGIAKGFFFVSLLFVITTSFMSGSNNYLKKSISYPFLSSSSKAILTFIQDHDIRSYFVPKEPAIKLPSVGKLFEEKKEKKESLTPAPEKEKKDNLAPKEKSKIYL